jgi:hypothetical protein
VRALCSGSSKLFTFRPKIGEHSIQSARREREAGPKPAVRLELRMIVREELECLADDK